MTGAPAPHRIGQPSPLIFHLGAALATYGQGLMAAPRADSPDFPWRPELAAAAARLGPDLDQLEVAHEIAARLQATIAGLEAWQRHPYRRTLAEPPAIWQAGCSRLLDYGRAPEATDPEGPPVLVVPSLINRAYILDLAPGRSLLRFLAARGLRPILMDWGEPGPSEARFDLEAYGARRLLPALARVREMANGPVPVLGYCMGGTLALGLAARAPEAVSRLATIGAPWDFASTRGLSGGLRAMVRAKGPEHAERLLAGLGEAFGLVPVPVFQFLFALINPIQAALKFQKLARLDPADPAALRFVALEDWLADGVPMPAPAATDVLVGWHVRNATARRQWRFLGGVVEPAAVRVPLLAFCGQGDTIAPPPLAEALADAVPGARILRPRTGHVGMVVGGDAQRAVMRPLAEFLESGPGRPLPPAGQP